MRFALGPLRVTIKYTFTKDGSTYYQRAVPTDLRDRYPGKTVKVHLKTVDPLTVARMVEKLNRKFEAEWAGLRASPDSTPDASKAHARDYLRRWGLEPMNTDNPPAALELLRQHWDDKRAEFAGGDDRAYREAHPTDYLSDTERAAWKALYTAPKPTIADLRDLYLSSHVKRDEAGFRKLTNIAFDGLMGAVGTKDIESFTRADVRAYVEAEIAKGNKTTTVRRRLNVFVAAWSAYARETESDLRNPFERFSIAGEGNDKAKRKSFTTAQITALLGACREADDDPRWLFALMIDTGARIGEMAGLTLDDLKLDAPIPHVVIQTHPWRSLKNRNSARAVPLVGASLWAAQRIHTGAKDGQRYAFPRYTKARGEGDVVSCSNASASATLLKWLQAQGVEGGVNHELRHTMNDRLREVQCPKYIQQAIVGHGVKDITDNYGQGYGLQVKLEWLARVALPVA